MQEGLAEYFEEKDAKNNSESSEEKIPDDLINSNDFFERYGEEMIDDIYQWYATAMQRRDREPLEKNRFISHFFKGFSTDPTYLYGDYTSGYLLGIFKNDIFIPTHFAPKTMRGGLGKAKICQLFLLLQKI